MITTVISAKAILLIILLGALAGCGSASPTPTSAPTPTPTSTQSLEARARAAYSFALDRNWLEMTSYISPRAREVCDSSGYAARIGVFADLVIGMEGISESSAKNTAIEFIIEGVTAGGAEGTVLIDFLLNGEPVALQYEGKRRWVLLDGQWWEEHEAWQDGCVGWKLFG